ncbi:unnamed protein product [Pleuronectes platessa]|uniref:Uncharacterized protein n=1 Tax=Pleuronectes platessa TaxID=8262 RepID=A0A9N7Z7N2_PLEPL|nr:unnamed protein product [Pleuronectes platessa]
MSPDRTFCQFYWPPQPNSSAPGLPSTSLSSITSEAQGADDIYLKTDVLATAPEHANVSDGEPEWNLRSDGDFGVCAQPCDSACLEWTRSMTRILTCSVLFVGEVGNVKCFESQKWRDNPPHCLGLQPTGFGKKRREADTRAFHPRKIDGERREKEKGGEGKGEMN